MKLRVYLGSNRSKAWGLWDFGALSSVFVLVTPPGRESEVGVGIFGISIPL